VNQLNQFLVQFSHLIYKNN